MGGGALSLMSIYVRIMVLAKIRLIHRLSSPNDGKKNQY